MPSLPKSLWTEDDFDVMGWHDNAVHAWAWEPSDGDRPWDNTLMFDLDYIVEWVHPDEDGWPLHILDLSSNAHLSGANDLKFDAEEGGVAPFGSTPSNGTPRQFHRGIRFSTLGGSQGHNFYTEFQGQGFEQYLRMPPDSLHQEAVPLAR